MNPLRMFAPEWIRRLMWNREFRNGHWSHLDNTATDAVYPMLAKYLQGGALLDLGCATGQTARELPKGSFSRYLGVDIATEAVEQARERTREGAEFTAGDIETFTPSFRCDVILFRETIYYIPTAARIEAMLNRYWMHLTERGVFVIRIWKTDKYPALMNLLYGRDILESKPVGEGVLMALR